MKKLEVLTDEDIGCLFCGEEIIALGEPVEMRCVICGEKSMAKSHCAQMHYVCEKCFGSTPTEFVTKYCLNSKSIDPIAMAVEIMNSPVIKMHGPEHHYIVPAVLLTAIHNLRGESSDLQKKLTLAIQRAGNTAPICAYNIGMCGAAIGTGIFLSIFTDQEPGSEDEWTLSNSIIADSLKRVAESPGPRCCKRDTYISIEQTILFLKEKFAIELPLSEAKCTFSMRNRTCRHEDCTFYNISFSLV